MANLEEIESEFRQKMTELRRNLGATEHMRRYDVPNIYSDLAFYTHSMYHYHEIKTAVIDLCRRCEDTNRTSATIGAGSQSLMHFHCEFTDYLRVMEQYPESYCHSLVESNGNKVVAVYITNLKQLYFGPYVITALFARLFRVDPNHRRKNLGTYLVSSAFKQLAPLEVDCILGYTLTTNIPSLAFQHRTLVPVYRGTDRLNIFIVPTGSNSMVIRLHKLTQMEVERLWTVDLVDWINRPVFSDLYRIMQMSEYLGTFAVGDFPTGQYAIASVWQPSSVILCDDRSNMKNTYRGPFRLIFNFFQSTSVPSSSNDNARMLLSALSNAAAIDGIPFMLCQIDESSPFNLLCLDRAVAMTTEIMTRDNISHRMTVLKDKFDKLSTWLDPRDFSGLLYFFPVSNKVQSQL